MREGDFVSDSERSVGDFGERKNEVEEIVIVLVI